MSDKLEALSKPVFEIEVSGDTWLNCSAGKLMPTDDADFSDWPDGTNKFYSQDSITALLDENQYMKVKIKEMGLLFGGLLLTMQAAVIELEHGEGPAAAMQWIFNKLLGPGEFAPDAEKDAQAYFNRESEKIDVEFAKCQEFYKQQREAKSL